jgi:hypothetical protein
VVGRDEAVHAHGPVEVHLPGDTASELDGLYPAAKRLREDALDQPLQPLLELMQSHLSGEHTHAAPGTLRGPRASGGIGRRAGFRFLCPKGRGGSSPPSPTRVKVLVKGGAPTLQWAAGPVSRVSCRVPRTQIGHAIAQDDVLQGKQSPADADVVGDQAVKERPGSAGSSKTISGDLQLAHREFNPPRPRLGGGEGNRDDRDHSPAPCWDAGVTMGTARINGTVGEIGIDSITKGPGDAPSLGIPTGRLGLARNLRKLVERRHLGFGGNLRGRLGRLGGGRRWGRLARKLPDIEDPLAELTLPVVNGIGVPVVQH